MSLSHTLTPLIIPSLTCFSLCLCLSLSLSACAGEGSLAVRIYGEPFIEEGIPAEAMADGWAVDFERFSVEVREVEVSGERLSVGRALDLTPASNGAGVALGALTLPEGDHPTASYTLGALRVEGSALHAERGEMKRFSWIIEAPTRYESCALGASLEAEGGAEMEVTVHADHLFYDSLVSEEPEVRFGHIAAADANGDGLVTRAELEGASVGALDVGSEGAVSDLWGWLEAHARTVGHINGEGHCEARTLEAP